jgi:hypothetical protein
METQENAEELAIRTPERRAHPRQSVDESAALLLVSQGSRVDCRVIELSLEGCRLSTQDRLLAGIDARVEVAFSINRIAFRFSGVIQWTHGNKLVGIRFNELASRRRDELIEVLCEVAAENAVKAVREAAKKPAIEEESRRKASGKQAEDGRPVKAFICCPTEKNEPTRPPRMASGSPPKPTPPIDPNSLLGGIVRGPLGVAGAGNAISQPAIGMTAPKPSPTRALPSEPPNDASKPTIKTPAKSSGQDRRTQARHDVDTSAVILLVNIASRIPGRILNLSAGGCRIRTDDRFPVGIYTRVETEFQLEGLPFRLGGVVQAIQDRCHVGIRFLDMSHRKREQVEQLMEEIGEMEAGKNAAGAGESAGEAVEG